MKTYICMLTTCVLASCGVNAQNSLEDFKKRIESEFSSFKNTQNKEFEDFRNTINEEYASFIKKAWKDLNMFKGIPVPDGDKRVVPVVYVGSAELIMHSKLHYRQIPVIWEVFSKYSADFLIN